MTVALLQVAWCACFWLDRDRTGCLQSDARHGYSWGVHRQRMDGAAARPPGL